MITKTLNSVFGRLTCYISNPRTVAIELPQLTPVEVRGIKLRFKIVLTKDAPDIWNYLMPAIIVRVGSFGDISKSTQNLIINKVVDCWQKFIDANAILQCELEIQEKKEKIKLFESQIQTALDAIKNCELDIAKAREFIPIIQNDIEEIRKKFFSKKA